MKTKEGIEKIGLPKNFSKNEEARFRAPKCPFCGWEGSYYSQLTESKNESPENSFYYCPDCMCPLESKSHEYVTNMKRAQKRFIKNKGREK